MTEPRVSTHHGWELLHLTSDDLEVDVVPGKGGDVTAVRWRPLDVDVMWRTRWGLRPRGEHITAGSSEALLMQAYPGGWQTVFPNAGAPSHEHGVEWGMHGEAWLASYDWSAVDGASAGSAAVELRTDLVRSPFSIVKRVEVAGPSVTVTETVTNDGAEPVEVMWSQHPAFGAPLVGPATRIETAARTIWLDPATPAAWPNDGFDRVPAPGSGVSRLAFLADFAEGRAGIVNDELGLRADLTWDTSLMPHAWYWLEAGGRAGFPWYSAAYVLALEPATSWPDAGVAGVRSTTGTQLAIAPGESRTATVTLTLAATAP
ncbi:aldose 1-epimerase [Jiangella aurantiaca]|uniref:Aldose 1-epimerase n=1 Tax=Jiangella aurantiaca TaxID=2530373 RepID=A0A4R4ZWV9_9ACTN|nr:aldose 1-epimerase [Jiangella aurantiaca]TDD63788.1 aldose 1-epimerase [Jiangella aurantiaca]